MSRPFNVASFIFHEIRISKKLTSKCRYNLTFETDGLEACCSVNTEGVRVDPHVKRKRKL